MSGADRAYSTVGCWVVAMLVALGVAMLALLPFVAFLTALAQKGPLP